jgi:hypothetical protein
MRASPLLTPLFGPGSRVRLHPRRLAQELPFIWRHSQVRAGGLAIRLFEAYTRLMKRLAVPVSESYLTVALVLSVLVMSFLLLGMMWQSSVIGYQRDLIRTLWQAQPR